MENGWLRCKFVNWGFRRFSVIVYCSFGIKVVVIGVNVFLFICVYYFYWKFILCMVCDVKLFLLLWIVGMVNVKEVLNYKRLFCWGKFICMVSDGGIFYCGLYVRYCFK